MWQSHTILFFFFYIESLRLEKTSKFIKSHRFIVVINTGFFFFLKKNFPAKGNQSPKRLSSLLAQEKHRKD